MNDLDRLAAREQARSADLARWLPSVIEARVGFAVRDPRAQASLSGLLLDDAGPDLSARLVTSTRALKRFRRSLSLLGRQTRRVSRTLARTEARQAGRRILEWSPAGDGSTPGRPNVTRPVIALGAKRPKPRHPGRRAKPVEDERGMRWREVPPIGPRSRSTLAGTPLPPAPRLRVPYDGRLSRATLRRDPRHQPPTFRTGAKGGHRSAFVIRRALAQYAARELRLMAAEAQAA